MAGLDADLESQVRYYCRRWPVTFSEAHGARMRTEDGHDYLDFFSGAGALSYGHNNPILVQAAVDHLNAGRVVQSLDMDTPEKRRFLNSMRDRILIPRNLDMVVQFVGPTGATAVEAALLLAERITGRSGVLAFSGGYHGMTGRAAEISASLDKGTTSRCSDPSRFVPFVTTKCESDITRLERALRSKVNGAAVGALVLEPVQGEGGARAFDPSYLRETRRLCADYGVIVIADEIQAGIGRTGPFFSFEGSLLDPDIICLSKSLSGLGLPLAINLVRRSLDQWTPGEFTGTFRGSNIALATATAMLDYYWTSDLLQQSTAKRARLISSVLVDLAVDLGLPSSAVRGAGMLWGLEFGSGLEADAVANAAFGLGLIVETCGQDGRVIKLLPPLVIDEVDLVVGLDVLCEASRTVLASRRADGLTSPRGR